MEKAELPSRSTTTFAALSCRERKMRRGMSGAVAKRDSISRNTARSATAMPSVTSVRVEPQPYCSVLTMP